MTCIIFGANPFLIPVRTQNAASPEQRRLIGPRLPSGKDSDSPLLRDMSVLEYQPLEPEFLPLAAPKKNWKQRLEARFFLTTEDVKRHRGDVKLCNLHHVDQYLIRGAMPESEAAFEKLKNHHGVTTLIDLRGPETTRDKHFAYEERMAKKHGLQYKHIPLNSNHPPSREALAEFIATMRETMNNRGRAFIHCKHGIDRTGSVVVAYELFFKERTVNTAFEDMKRHGYNRIHQWKKPAQEAFIKNGQLQRLLNGLKHDATETERPAALELERRNTF